MNDYIILDVDKPTMYRKFRSNKPTVTRQGELASQVLDIQIVKAGVPYDLSECEVFFEAKRQDGHVIIEPCVITNALSGFVQFTVPEGMTLQAGKTLRAYLSVYKGEEVIATTEDMEMVNLPGVCFFADSDYMPYIERIIAKLEEYVEFGEDTTEVIQRLLSEASAAVSSANDASNAANEASETATTAATSALGATEAANNAAQRANDATDKLESAADNANAAASSANTAKANAAAAATAANNATGRANSAADEAEAFLKGFIVEYDNLSDACKEIIASSAGAGVEFATQAEIDDAFETEILPILAGGEMDNALTEEEYQWAIGNIFS